MTRTSPCIAVRYLSPVDSGFTKPLPAFRYIGIAGRISVRHHRAKAHKPLHEGTAVACLGKLPYASLPAAAEKENPKLPKRP